MIFTSYHPLSTLDLASPANQVCDANLFNTVEFAQLWYLYVRHYQPRDEHIVIVDQCSAFPIARMMEVVDEPWEVMGADDYLDPAYRVHVKRFPTKADKLGGVKRLYLWLYGFCWRQRADLWFIESDCLVAKDIVTLCADFDFVTNHLMPREQVCDTYLCKVSAARLRQQDSVYSLPDWLSSLRAQDTYRGTKWTEDVVAMALCERGAYARFCYGNAGSLKGDCVIHNETNAQLRAFLSAHPIAHPLYDAFVAKLEDLT